MNQNTKTASNLASSLVEKGIFNDRSTALNIICEEFGKKQLPLNSTPDELDNALKTVYEELVA